MRVSKRIGLGLALLLLTQTITACTVLRTPYEKAKINENGGTVEAPEDKEGGGKGGDSKGGSKKEEKAEPGKFKVQPNRAETYNQRRARLKQGGALTQSPYTQDTERLKMEAQQQEKGQKQGKGKQPTKATEQSTQTTMRMTYNRSLSSQVSKIEDIDSGIVLLDREHNAYVAVLSDTKQSAFEGVATQFNKALNIKSQGQVPPDTQRRIAERLRSADTKVGTVYITNDPSHVKSFQRYVSESGSGELSEMNAAALTEHIEDIWKK